MSRFTFYCFALALGACASSSIPKTFVYETSVRGEQAFVGSFAKGKSVQSLLAGGVVTDPTAALEAALPDGDIKLRRWGVVYFASNWERYQVILDADIRRDDETIKCREGFPETPVGALTLNEVRANDGAALQQRLNVLVEACAAKAR